MSFQVVWRRTSEPNPLTIGDFVYSPDDRITVRRVEDKNEWNLIIKDVQIADAGIYECAVSSREKYKRLVLLRVNGQYHSFIRSSLKSEIIYVFPNKDPICLNIVKTAK